MKIIFWTELMILTLSLTSCNGVEERLKGHWHLYRVDKEQTISFSAYSTLDIINDTLAIFDRNSLWGFGFEGAIDQENLTMLFGGECLVLNFRYDIYKGQLLLNQKEYDEEGEVSFIGQRCGKDCCNEEQDYFKDILVDIDLPTADKELEMLDSFPPNFVNPVFIGPIKKKYKEFYDEEYVVSLGGSSLGMDDLELWEAKYLMKLSKNYDVAPIVAIYSDVNVPEALVDTVRRKLKKYSQLGVYKAYEANRDPFQIVYESLDYDRSRGGSGN